MRRQRRLALGVLLAAAALAAAAFPFRHTWWGGWILAIAEAGIVGGLADWFAVTAIFRRPLGLPIPHTGLIQSNWEMLANRVGVMVGNRVLTKEYVTHEIGRVDVGELLARAAERISREEIEAATRAIARWAAEQITPGTAAELLTRLIRALAAEPIAPTLAAGLRVLREQGWDQRAIHGALTVLAEAMERPEFRETVGEVIDDLLARYRARLGVYPRLAVSLATIFGLIDRDRLVTALHAGLGQVVKDPDHPLRERAAEMLADLETRLRTDPALVARVEAAKKELLGTPAVTQVLEDAAVSLHRGLRADLASERSEMAAWIAERLERARLAFLADAALRRDVDRWLKQRVAELIERHHGRIAAFIENGVRALGPEGAVRLIEEHAGDDLQYIRVNGTVIGGLAGGVLYGIHLLIQLL